MPAFYRISNDLRVQLSVVFRDAVVRRQSLEAMGIAMGDELAYRLHVLGGMAGEW